MHSTTVAVDLAKDVIEVAVAGRQTRHERLGRTAFKRFLAQQPASRIVMESCGGAHYWARKAQAHGHEATILPALYVKAYRRRNKTDRADCLALLEAAKNPELKPVAVKTQLHQAIQGLHRLRSRWVATKTGRINTLRGLLHEFGITMPRGAVTALKQLPDCIDALEVPDALRPMLREVFSEILELKRRIDEIERQLKVLTADDPAVQAVQQVDGIGVMTSTALVASAVDAKNFRSGRHLASWIGLTPREYSSGHTRRIGSMSKRGDVYLRMLFIHGARSALLAAGRRQRDGKELTRLQRWALDLKARTNHNKAAVGLANKMARIAWAVWFHGRQYDANHAAA
jgi:transposase